MWSGCEVYLEVLRGDSVEKTSRVWSGNDVTRSCLLRTHWMISSLLFYDWSTDTGVRSKSIWCHRNCRGSRRRKAAALTESDYRVLVASWMMSRWLHYPDWVTIIAQKCLWTWSALCKPIAEWICWNISALADAENISRKIITRCITQPNCLNQLLLFFLTPVNYLPVRWCTSKSLYR